MGLYFRKSICVGPLRFNLSKSGVGISAGIKGLRFGTGPRGNYVHMGRGGLYYRTTLPPTASAPKPSVTPTPPPEPPDGTHAPLEEIESTDISQIIDSSSKELLDELNRKRAKKRLWPVAMIIAIAIFSLIFLLNGPVWLLTSSCLIGAIATYMAHARDTLQKTVVLFYDFDPDMETAYTRLHGAIDQIAHCKSLWHIEASGEVYDKKYHAGASSLLRRKTTTIRKIKPPYVKTNIETIAIGVGRQDLYFFPDRVLIYDKDGVGAVSYADLCVKVGPTRFIECETVPRDAEVVDHTWMYVNKSGGPDKRFKDNKELPICKYEEIAFSSPTGLNEIIHLSRCGFGSELVKALTQLGKKIPAENNSMKD